MTSFQIFPDGSHDRTMTPVAPGTAHLSGRMDVDVVVNLRARRGSAQVAEKCKRELPDARVLTSTSIDEIVRFARSDSLLVSGGGDGTALGLINSLRRRVMRHGGLLFGSG